VAVVQEIDVAIVHDARVPAGRAVFVGVTFVMGRHVNLLLRG
jgi:hypothetical protein